MQRDDNSRIDDAGNSGDVAGRIRALEQENTRLRGEIDHLHMVIDALPGPVAYIGPDHDLRVVNRACLELIGGPNRDLAGENLSGAIGARQYAEIGPYLERAFDGEEVEADLRIELPIAGVRTIRMTIRPDVLPDETVRGVLVHMVDVSSETGTQADAELAGIRLRRIADANILGIGFWKGSTIVEGNDTLLEMLGYSRHDLLGGTITIEAITAGEFQGAVTQAREEMLARGFTRPYEKELLRRDGSRLPVLFGMGLYEGHSDQGAFFALDISDRKKIDQALRDGEERYRALVDNSSEGIWRFELEVPVAVSETIERQLDLFYAHGYLAECNATMARMYGFDAPSDIVGARLGDLLVRTDPDNEAYLRAFVGSGYRLIDAESHELDNEGNSKTFLNNLIGIVQNGVLTRAWGTQRDITERKRVEGEIREAREAAEAANRSKDRFLATLSHELRTPLTPVVAAIDLLRSEEDLPEAVAAAVDIIARNVDLEARLIDDLLDLTRIRHGKLELRTESIELTPLVERVVEICRGDIEKRRLHLELNLDPRPYALDGDAGRLQQVLWNLLKNAIKFTPEGGRIWITSVVAGDGIRIEVGDSGIGIDPELLPRIFDPFEQGEAAITRRYGGLGLGLAISRTIVTMHGGTLAAQSDGPDRGAVFTMTLGGESRGS